MHRTSWASCLKSKKQTAWVYDKCNVLLYSTVKLTVYVARVLYKYTASHVVYKQPILCVIRPLHSAMVDWHRTARQAIYTVCQLQVTYDIAPEIVPSLQNYCIPVSVHPHNHTINIVPALLYKRLVIQHSMEHNYIESQENETRNCAMYCYLCA